jgi:hypothetical protein
VSADNGLLTLDAIQRVALPTEEVTAWGGRVRVRAMNAAERHQYRQAWAAMIGQAKLKLGKGLASDALDVDFQKMPDLDVLAASMCLVGSDGQRLCKSPADLATVDPSPIKAIADTARRLSGIDQLEEEVGNSSATPSSDSSSRSPTTSESQASESSTPA